LGEFAVIERSESELIELVGEDIGVSGVQLPELIESDGVWQLELLKELIELGLLFLITDSSAAVMRDAALSKWARACRRRLVRSDEASGCGLADISIDVAA